MDKEKVVWITGASAGIGKALALEFLKNGKNVIASARRSSLLDELEKEAEGCGYKGKVIAVPLNISSNTEIEAAVGMVEGKYQIDCLVNNAGITTFTLAEKDTKESIREIIETNLIGAINMIKTILPYMAEREGGVLINTISVTAKKVFTRSSAYAASKAGLLAYTDVLREEVREKNIKVINVFPGATSTPIWPGQTLEKYSGRMMKPEDVASMIYKLYETNSSIVPEEIVLRPMKGDL